MALSEQLADRLTGGKLSEQAETISNLQETAVLQANDIFVLRESLERLEQALYSPDWRALSRQGEVEFTRQGIRDITRLARLMEIKNPLIHRGVRVQQLYVWAQGVSVAAKEAELNDVLNVFLDDERNRAELTGHQARSEKERRLQTDGNLFFRFFVNQQTGRVRLRSIEPDEIDDIICNPEDAKEAWFYKRTWTQQDLNGGQITMTEYYPDLRYTPRARQAPAGWRVNWDTPVMHVAVNRLGMWGISEVYAALDWALAYKSFLEQLASVWQALARWAMKLTTKGGARGVAAARTKLNTTLGSGGESNPAPVTGSTFIQGEGVDLQPFRTQGATMSAEDGRRLLLMATAVMGFPETFYSDVSVGTLATAKSLDRPTELQITDRQTLWTNIYRDIFNYVFLCAAKAGRIPGARFVREPDGDEWIERVEWANLDATVSIEFPPIVESDTPALVGATIDAATMKGTGQGIPAETAVQRLLTLLGVPDIDAVMEIWRQERDLLAQRAEAETQTQQQEAYASMMMAVNNLIDSLGESANGH